MADMIPNFFNKGDFWAMLLPGYVTLILGILLFHPTSITGDNKDTKNTIPVEILSVVVFIVAGPSIGSILSQIYTHLSSAYQFLFGKSLYNIKYSFEREYGRLRLLVKTDAERLELDSLDGRHTFGTSTAIGLGIIGITVLCIPFLSGSICTTKGHIDLNPILCKDVYLLVVNHIFPMSWFNFNVQGINIHYVPIIILIIAFILGVGSFYYNKDVRLVIICRYIKKYNLDLPTTCTQRESRLKKKRIKVVLRAIEDKYPEAYRGNRHQDNKRKEERINLLIKRRLLEGKNALEEVEDLLNKKILFIDYGNKLKINENKYHELYSGGPPGISYEDRKELESSRVLFEYNKKEELINLIVKRSIFEREKAREIIEDLSKEEILSFDKGNLKINENKYHELYSGDQGLRLKFENGLRHHHRVLTNYYYWIKNLSPL
jgi:hypothetical protein